MTISDLIFLGSVLFVLIWCARIAVSAMRGRRGTAGRLARFLGLFLASYAVALMALALIRPRRFYAPGERRCYEDWCVTALSAQAARSAAESPCSSVTGGRNWNAAVEVSSVARGVSQRAPDARAELEDIQGTRYQPCAGPDRPLSDEVGPGESFRTVLPFRLPVDAMPAGLVLHHGDFPGILIIGADQSFWHRPALQRFTVEQPQ